VSESRTITLNGRKTPYRLARSARRRTIGLQVGRDGLVVRAPAAAGLSRIERAVTSREDWICGKLEAWAARPSRPAPRFETGDRLPWLGRDLRLEVRALARGARTRVDRDGEMLGVRLDPALAGELRAATARRALERWYRREAEAAFAPRLARFAEALGRPAPRLIVRSHKARWGSCDPRGVIRMNWRLVGAEDALIDYVCAHEAAHLVEANHSSAFWAVVEALIPDHKARRRRLRDTEGLIAPF